MVTRIANSCPLLADTATANTTLVDHVGIVILIGVVAFASGVAAIFALEWRRGRREVDEARQWPQTEATIESAALEPPKEGRYALLPTFGFSYEVAGERYSGRFSLLRSKTVSPESLLLDMPGHKLQVHYNPQQPKLWFIPDELIKGCKVEQKMGPHVTALYPR
jgi:Protein of unknown function (DUF3592)